MNQAPYNPPTSGWPNAKAKVTTMGHTDDDESGSCPQVRALIVGYGAVALALSRAVAELEQAVTTLGFESRWQRCESLRAECDRRMDEIGEHLHAHSCRGLFT